MKAAFGGIADPREGHMNPPVMRKDMAVLDLASRLAGIAAGHMRRQMVIFMDGRGEFDWPFP